jgi:hypothetical protein
MKKNNKAIRIEFIEYAKEVLKAYGFKSIENNYYIIESQKGKFKLKLPLQEDHMVLFSAFGRFDYLNDLTGCCNHKHNFHHSDMSMFENYIGHIVDELELSQHKKDIKYFLDFIDMSVKYLNTGNISHKKEGIKHAVLQINKLLSSI